MQSTNSDNLIRLGDAGDLRVAEGNEDVRGWEVRAQNGDKIGKVKDLLVDPSAMRARYLDVQLSGGLFGKGRRVLVPVGIARLADDDDVVLLSADANTLQDYPEYDGSAVSRDYETSLRSRLSGGSFAASANANDYYAHEHYDDRGLYGSRRDTADLGNDREARLTVSREELNIGKRRVQAGEAYLRKRVETEHVSENVPLMREEVTIERHPISANDRVNATIGQDEEIRVPLMAEEAVVEKRVVGEEEVVLRKRAVEENRTVEADLRRERVDVDDASVRAGSRNTVDTRDSLRGGASRAAGATERGADRVADKVDDLKDRVDGNPASRPGLDATDSSRRADSAMGRSDTLGHAGDRVENTADRAGNTLENAWDKTKNAAHRAGEKIADTVDDTKDRVDGNPSSRPGPDRTDDRDRLI